IADTLGEPVASVAALRTRPTSKAQLQSVLDARHDALYRVDWPTRPFATSQKLPGRWALLCTDDGGIFAELEAASVKVERHADIAELKAWLSQSQPAPDVVVIPCASPTGDLTQAAHDATCRGLSLLQSFLADSRLTSTRLVLLTYRAIATRP